MRFNDDQKIKIDVTQRKNNKKLKFVSRNFRVTQRYEAKGKNLRKAAQSFEIKKRKIDIFGNYEANGVEKKTTEI